MKKLLLLAACVSTFSVMAQQWVDTVPLPRRAILEEFTGVNCGYCPDGHRIANEMVADNPNKVFLVNIHAGGYATPGAGQPDLRTTAGNAIDGAAGVTGYPSGSVNRATNPWGQGRNLWKSAANGIVAQTSPVNVKVKSFVDVNTRILTTEVEVYYTSNSAVAKNYLTVALTQDDILGPQIDYGDYNPTNWVNGLYRHNHVLRQLITAGNFGESIDTTTKGYYMYKKYTTVIPESYTNIKAVLNKLNVVAFVSQANNNILSGDGAHVDFDQTLKTDLSVVNKTAEAGMCATSITPSAEVTNASDQTINSFSITATVNNVAYAKTVVQTLVAGAKTTVTWDPITLTNGGSFSYSIGAIDNILGDGDKKLFDIEMTNDGASKNGFAFKVASVPNNNVWCGFETMKNTALDLTVSGQALVAASSTVNYGSWSKNAFLVYLHESWNVAGKPVNILLGKADLNAISKPGMAYMYAYSDGGMGGSAPTVTVNISKDCGSTWTAVSNITPTETGQPADATKLYIPAGGAYKMVKVDLAAYKTDEIIAKITVTPGTNGNSFFLDEISLTSFAKLGLKENVSVVNFNVYPNPANGNFTINLKAFQNASYVITDISGKQVKASNLAGEETSVNCEGLNSGVYFVEVNADGAKSTQKIVITK
jgi:hypothetical protein